MVEIFVSVDGGMLEDIYPPVDVIFFGRILRRRRERAGRRSDGHRFALWRDRACGDFGGGGGYRVSWKAALCSKLVFAFPLRAPCCARLFLAVLRPFGAKNSAP